MDVYIRMKDAIRTGTKRQVQEEEDMTYAD